MGHAPELAVDGPDALERMHTAAHRGEPFDLAILDFNMPDMDGAELPGGSPPHRRCALRG